MYDNLTRTNLEFAHREAEKRIADLEKENANLKALRKYELKVAKLEIENLEKENTELKARLNAINQLIPELEKIFYDLLKMTEQEAD